MICGKAPSPSRVLGQPLSVTRPSPQYIGSQCIEDRLDGSGVVSVTCSSSSHFVEKSYMNSLYLTVPAVEKDFFKLFSFLPCPYHIQNP